MFKVRYNNIINLVWYQALWFLAILGRENYDWALVLLICLHFFLSPCWRADMKTMIACASVGIFADSILAVSGVYVFDPEPAILPIPFWLVAIWLGFSCTLLHSFTFFMTRPLIGTLIVSAAAPFSYLAGSRFGAVNFGYDTTTSILIIAATWLLIMTALVQISALFRPLSPGTSDSPKEA
jgi:hypothetical protein